MHGKVLKVRNVSGKPKARFHNTGCRECFEEDKEAGLIYSLYRLEDGRIMDVYDASIEADFCAYCGTVIEDEEEPQLETETV